MITVLTPTYNRGYCLENLYNSLRNQSDKDFEWIVVDDGSTDDTEEKVMIWAGDTKDFSIHYYKQKNGGKHRAVNYGVTLAIGEYTFIVDSDDSLTEDCIFKINGWIEEIDGDSSFAGVSGVRGRNKDSIIGSFPSDKYYIDASNIERARLGLLGDKAEVYRTNILRSYPFPEFEGERFLPENVVWDEIAHDGYKLRWHRDVIYICEYLEDGLTKNSDSFIKKSFNGYTLAKKKAFHYYPSPTRWGALLSYMEDAKSLGMGDREIGESLDVSLKEYLVGKMMYGFWKLRNKYAKDRSYDGTTC